MRVGLYSPYLDTFGGGERYLATAAEFFAKSSEVIIFWDSPKILAELEKKFRLDLKKGKIHPNIFKENFFKRWKILKDFDLVFILSDGSIPTPFAKINILHFQQPFKINGRTFPNRLKLARYRVICNSQFTKKFIDESFGINSQVIYPPVDVNFFIPNKKENIIFSVGRFVSGGAGKKQEFLIEAFRSALSAQRSVFREWRLFLAGGVGNKGYFSKLQQAAKGLPVEFFPDSNANELRKLYGVAKIYWHAKGFGENIKNHQEFAEHFGIAIVEAQSSSCVPVVFKAGGVTEIIRDGVSGFFWTTKDGLLEKTKNLIQNPVLLANLQQKSIENAKKFSKEVFRSNFAKLISW